MKKFIGLMTFSIFMCACGASVFAQQPSDKEKLLVNQAVSATALLLAPLTDGGTRMLCTATVIGKTATAYRFLSASHCVATDDENHKIVKIDRSKFYLTFDEAGSKKLLQAKVLVAGYQHRGDDFAILEVLLADMQGLTPPILPIALKEAELGEQLINVAAPGGYGRQLFRGHVSMQRIDRPVRVGDINWENAMFIQMEVGGGSSGSAIVSIWQGGIVGCVVGVAGGNTVAIPIKRFKKFWTMYQKGQYKWFKPDEAIDGSD